MTKVSDLTAMLASEVADRSKVHIGASDMQLVPGSRRFSVIEVSRLMSPWRNVLDYGAKGNGSDDDTLAVQAAIDAGGVIYFPGGRTYKISSSLALIDDDLTLIGDGPTSIIEMSVGNLNGISILGSSTANKINRIRVSNLWIKGPGENYIPSTPRTDGGLGCGIRIYYAHHVTIDNCLLSHWAGDQIRLYGCGDVHITDNWCFECYNRFDRDSAWSGQAYCDLRVDSYCEHTTITGNHFHSNCQLHAYISGDEIGSVIFSDNVCFSCSSEGVPLVGKSGLVENSYETWNNVRHNLGLNYGNHSLEGEHGRIIVANNLFSTARWCNLYAHDIVDGYVSNNGQRIVITGNVFHAGGWFNDNSLLSPTMTGGVTVHSGRELVFAGNLVVDYKGVPFSQPAVWLEQYCQNGITLVKDNIIADSASNAISIGGETSQAVIDGNICWNVTGYAIDYVSSDTIPSSITITAINTSGNTFTATGHGLAAADNGLRVRLTLTGGNWFTADGIPIDANTTYYFQYVDANTFQLRATPSGNPMDLLTSFTGTLTMHPQKWFGGQVITNNVIHLNMDQMILDKMEFPAASITIATDRIKMPETYTGSGVYQKHGLNTGDFVLVGSNGTIFQIASADPANYTKFYVTRIDDNTFELWDESGSAKQDITSAGSGTHWFRRIRPRATGGIRLSRAADTSTAIVRGNKIVSHQDPVASWGSYGYGINVDESQKMVVSANVVEGFSNGILLAGSITSRCVETVQVSENFIRKCGIGIRVDGTINGLCLIDGSNVVDSVSGAIAQLNYSSSQVGMWGRRVGRNIICPHKHIPDRTFTFASGATITSVGHGFANGDRLRLTGSPPSPFVAGTDYWVVNKATDTLELSATRGGSAESSSGAGSATAVLQLGAFGSYLVGDRFESTGWTGASDWADAFCTTAGDVGTAVFTKRYLA